MSKFRVGDIVHTTQGNRVNGGIEDRLTVLEVNRKWKQYHAVLCRREDFSRHLYLEKNLELVDTEC